MIAAGGDLSEATIACTVGGLIIGASAIPVFYRDRIERLQSGQTGARHDHRIEDRMLELEQRHQEDISLLLLAGAEESLLPQPVSLPSGEGAQSFLSLQRREWRLQ